MRLGFLGSILIAAVLGLQGCATTGPREQAGLLFGGASGRGMDNLDRRYAGYQYQITAAGTYETQAGPCRECRGRSDDRRPQGIVYGTARRQADGCWKMRAD